MIFDEIKPERVLEEVEKGLGEGDLTLGIHCTKCNAEFELNREAVTMAIMMNTSFIEYLRYIQSSNCPKCNPKKEE